MADLSLLLISHIVPSASEQPVVNLRVWQVIRMNDEPFLLGGTRETSKLRATSRLTCISRDRTAMTRSGRVYHLERGPGDTRLALVWPQFHLDPWTELTEEAQGGFDILQ